MTDPESAADTPDEKLTSEQQHLKELRRSNKAMERIAGLLERLADKSEESCAAVCTIARALSVTPPAPPTQAVGPVGKNK